MKFVVHDGGRKKAGYKGKTGDCFVRATAITTKKPYQEIYDAVIELGKKERIGKNKTKRSHPRTGVYRTCAHKYLLANGFEWIPARIKITDVPLGIIIVNLRKHYAAVINGVLYDTWNCSKHGEAFVYGYWIKKPEVVQPKPIFLLTTNLYGVRLSA